MIAGERETAWCLHTNLLFWLGFLESRNTMFESQINLVTTASDEDPCADPESFVRGGPKIVSEYDQEIPQSQTADNPVASQGRAAQPS